MANATAPTNTIVVNNRESLIQIQLPNRKKEGAATGPLISLLPGANFVESQLWEEAKKNAGVQQMLKDAIQASRAPEQNPDRVGKVTLEEGPTVTRDNPLAALKDEEAIVMVDEILDVPTLRKLRSQETRPGVASALQKQMQKIEKPEVKRAS